MMKKMIMGRHHFLYVMLLLSCTLNTCLFFSLIWNFEFIGLSRDTTLRSRSLPSEPDFLNYKPLKFAPRPDNSKFIKGHNSHKSLKNTTTTTTTTATNLEVEDIGGVLIYPNNNLLPDYQRNVEELYERIVPNNVFYVWCGKRVFEFQHYLSVLSVWYHLEPDVIEIQYENPPQEDKYNTWLSTLRAHIPVLTLHHLPPYATGNDCSPTFGLELILDRGGVFINDGVILHSVKAPGLNFLLDTKVQMSFFPDKTIAWAASVRKSPALKHFVDTYFASGREVNVTSQKLENFFRYNNVFVSSCSNIASITASAKGVEALKVDSVKSSDYGSNNGQFCFRCKISPNPVDFFQNTTTTNLLVTGLKSLVLQSDDSRFSKRLKDRVKESYSRLLPIPSAVHYVWFGSKSLSFSMYLSFISTVNILRPSSILIHTDLMLYGSYWDRICQHHLVHVIYRESPRTIFGRRILYTQHRSDIVRADVLDKYGGIYLDWDVYWVKPVDRLRNSRDDVIISRDHMPRPPFPDTINMGVVLARPRSAFIRRWRSSLINYKSRDFLYNAVELPYKVYEAYPHRVHLYDRLQVMCYFLKCHPAFHADFKQWGDSQPFDWRTDVHAMHFTHPDPPAFHNETALQHSQGTFADVGRFIWNSS